MIPWENTAQQLPSASALVVADVLMHAAVTVDTWSTPACRGRCEGVGSALRVLGPLRIDPDTLRRLLLQAGTTPRAVLQAAREKSSTYKGEGWTNDWREVLAQLEDLAKEAGIFDFFDQLAALDEEED